VPEDDASLYCPGQLIVLQLCPVSQAKDGPAMKNFLRALRYVWPYRRRLTLSIICAVLAAILWGLNFTAVYPFLKILTTGQSLQTWIDETITNQEKVVEVALTAAGKASTKEEEIRRLPDSKERENNLRKASGETYKAESKLESARKSLYYYQVLRKYIDKFCPGGPFQTIVMLMVVVIIATAIKGIFEFSQEVLVGSVVNLSLFDLRNRFYRNVIHLDVDQFHEQGTPEMMARFTNDVEVLGQGQRTLFERVVAEPLRALSCIIVACLINWQLTLFFLILVPIALFFLTKVGRVMKRATHRLLERLSSIYKILQESFKNIKVVKSFTMEPYERRRFHDATRDYYKKSMRVVRLNALTSPVVEFLGVMAIGAALIVGAHLVISRNGNLGPIQFTDQPMEAETLLQLYILLAAIADPVRKLASVYTKLQSGYAAADRIFAVMDRQPRVQANSEGPRFARVEESIEFRNVSFSYDPGTPILTNVNLTVKAGEIIAFVGKNGCGKSTLLGMLPRFYDPHHGSILVDGHDIRTLNLRSLRARIAVVTQQPHLFDDTIYNNISYGNRRAGAEDVERAAKLAGAHEFISQTVQGYQTPVGEAGGMKSGGEVQKIQLARAILRDPSILILDEFTSQIDAESEARIHKTIREFAQGRTVFLITHRINTLEMADRIVVIDEGRIIAVGTHKELIAVCPLYQCLYEASVQTAAA
jgi:ATP-binding cassette subfamily B protein/subfamily B ATP-binding cassette protein MsbA